MLWHTLHINATATTRTPGSGGTSTTSICGCGYVSCACRRHTIIGINLKPKYCFPVSSGCLDIQDCCVSFAIENFGPFCNRQKGYKEYKQRVWDLPDGDVKLVCTPCTRGRKKKGEWTCRSKQCQKQLPIQSFSLAISKHGARVCGNSRRCNDCMERQQNLENDALRESMMHVQKSQRT